MYYSQIRTDPKDRSRVYLLGSNRGFYISDDGGKTFRDVFGTVHSEDHALWIDPDTNHLIVAGDGGVSNMPNVPVDDILIHPRDNDIIVGTHGRSIWVLDDASKTVDALNRVLSTDMPDPARLMAVPPRRR